VTSLGIVGVLVFVVGLLLSVMLHEAGHFLTARRYGVKVTQFFVGFGPTLWSRQRGETEYGVKAIPAGGFVKIIGMTSLEEVAPEDEKRAFYRLSAGRKTVVLAAGSTVHFIIAVLLVVGVTAVFGVPKEGSPSVAAISACVNDEAGSTSCTVSGAVPAPAKQAGLLPGDVVVAVDGVKTDSSEGLVAFVKARPGATVDLTVQRDGRTLVLPVVPAAVTRDGEQVGAIGVSLQASYVNERYGVVGTVQESGRTLGLILTGTWDTLTQKLGTITKVYTPERDPNGFIGVVGAGRISGEIAALEIPTSDKIANLFLLLAGLNLFVGIFNLLPLLPLDGGHIAVVFFEQLRDKARRLRGYTGELQRVDMNKLLPVTFAVVVLFAGFTLFLLGADIVNPITLN
jgi:membrane-associated protease RseP (regulator of RpoE activity)